MIFWENRVNWEWKKRIYTYKSVSPLTGPGAPCGGGLSGLCPLIIVFNFLVFNHLQFQNFQHIHHFQHPPRNFYIIPSKNFKNHEKILKHLLYQGLQTISDIFDFPLKIKCSCRWFFFWRQKVHSLALFSATLHVLVIDVSSDLFRLDSITHLEKYWIEM